MSKTIRQAVIADALPIIAFLKQADLSTEGVYGSIDRFLVVENEEGDIIGTLGIETRGKVGLLRSLVVTPSFSTEELFALFQESLKLAKDKEIERLYLITNRQASLRFFHLLGFSESSFVDDLAGFVHAQKLSTVDNCMVMKLDM
ncbi:GNAT family N-acetyltransferase [Rossellomorea marisflavi]|uniref:GNAT family N-acetyltransferase n=1 Tax=Rossellomorea marisflavi TaxID=189381 RepID=UPI003513B40E